MQNKNKETRTNTQNLQCASLINATLYTKATLALQMLLRVKRRKSCILSPFSGISYTIACIISLKMLEKKHRTGKIKTTTNEKQYNNASKSCTLTNSNTVERVFPHVLGLFVCSVLFFFIYFLSLHLPNINCNTLYCVDTIECKAKRNETKRDKTK